MITLGEGGSITNNSLNFQTVKVVFFGVLSTCFLNCTFHKVFCSQGTRTKSSLLLLETSLIPVKNLIPGTTIHWRMRTSTKEPEGRTSWRWVKQWGEDMWQCISIRQGPYSCVRWRCVLSLCHQVSRTFRTYKSTFFKLQNLFSSKFSTNHIRKQDCIPVGCIPPTRWPYLPACSARWGVSSRGCGIPACTEADTLPPGQNHRRL